MLRLRARWVLPIDSPPIENGEVIVENGAVAEVRPASPARDSVDFGDSVILPGLVNVHAHIDYTVMRGLLEDLPFFEWIKQLTARKAVLDEQDWISSATLGAAEAVAGGVTTLGDCTDSGAALFGARNIGLRGTIYQEAFAVDESVPVSDTIAELDTRVRAMRWAASGTRLKIGVSPHALYTVRPEAVAEIARYARENHLPVCIHAAESQEEMDWLRHGGGCIGERDSARGIGWMRPAPGCTPLEMLQQCGALTRDTLLVHGVQLAAGDRALIRESQCAWAHCPKSNAKLGNGIAPLGLLRDCYPETESRIGLGSDSVASNNTMDLFEEMRFAVLAQRARSRKWQSMTAAQALELATIGGARALGMDASIGSLAPGKQADIAVVRLNSLASTPAHDPVSALVYSGSARDVEMTMIGGETVYERGRLTKADLQPHRARVLNAAARLRAWSPPA